MLCIFSVPMLQTNTTEHLRAEKERLDEILRLGLGTEKIHRQTDDPENCEKQKARKVP